MPPILRIVTLSTATRSLMAGTPPGAAGSAATPGVVTQTLLGERDFDRMQRGGVETLRFLISRKLVEPARGQYDWSTVDAVVSGAAKRDIELLPFVYGSPEWVDASEEHPPLAGRAERDAWRRFLTTLVDRYGRHGEFWAGPGAAHAIRRWQIWNEPNFDFYWEGEPSPRDYAKLISISADAIRGADPGAKIMLAGVARVRLGMPWWMFLTRFYEVPGVKRDFDYVALHPYSPGLRILGEYVELARHVMREAGDGRTSLAITEIGWASDGDPGAPLVVGECKQARLLRRSFAFLSEADTGWRISDAQWYSWRDTGAIEPFCTFCEHSGLFTGEDESKPAWRAFQRAAR
jgi:polysaccharide biosynthesis protein PslG